MKFLASKLENRIQITVKHDRDLRSGPDLANAIEYATERCAGGQRALVGELIDDSVSQRIRKRQPELDQISARSLQCERDLDSSAQIRIAGANVRNESLAILGMEPGEAIVDAVFQG